MKSFFRSVKSWNWKRAVAERPGSGEKLERHFLNLKSNKLLRNLQKCFPFFFVKAGKWNLVPCILQRRTQASRSLLWYFISLNVVMSWRAFEKANNFLIVLCEKQRGTWKIVLRVAMASKWRNFRRIFKDNFITRMMIQRSLRNITLKQIRRLNIYYTFLMTPLHCRQRLESVSAEN